MRMRTNSVRRVVSYENYADLATVCKRLTNVYVTNEQATDIVNKLMNRINTKQRKIGHLETKTPSIKFYGSSDGGCYEVAQHQLRLSNKPSVYLIVHELAHALHYKDSMSWQIKRTEMDGRFDWHGVRFCAYMKVLRDIIEGQKYFQKYLVK